LARYLQKPALYANRVQQYEKEPGFKRQSGPHEYGPRILANVESYLSHYGGNRHRLVHLNDHREFTT
jgi:hypothetical protein